MAFVMLSGSEGVTRLRFESRRRAKSMPPWFAVPGIGHFSNDPSLTAEQIATLTAWANAGVPAGDAKDAPPPMRWAESGRSASPISS